ncbi:MAG: glycosyltransferase [Candidatus Latescibacteria bacterium]|nr:glycosyltransferase [bacterium]MBD3425543.1 glycosyltransferase [Candidatus Latescibacterota bacterium]
MDSLSVLFFISSIDCGGAENHLLNLCRYLSGRGNQLHICALSGPGGDLEADFEKLGVRIEYLDLPSLRTFLNPVYMKRFREIVREFSPDIIHAHLYHAEAAAAVATFFGDAPLVVTRHSSGLEFNGTRRLVSRAVSSRISRLIAVSSEAAQEAENIGISARRISVIESGVDTSLFRPLEQSERERRRSDYLSGLFADKPEEPVILIGSVGGLKPVKNYPLFIEMAARLIKQGDLPGELRFVIVGDGQQRDELSALIEELGLKGVAALPGRDTRVQELLPLFDIFVLTSDSEGVPVALLEALSCGLPCVASRVGGIPETVAGNALLPEPGDLDGFFESVRSLIMDGNRRAVLGAAGRELAVGKYGLQGWGDRNLSVYLSAIRS